MGEPLTGWVNFLAALAAPSRLRIVWALRGGPMTVGAVAAAVGLRAVYASDHLGVLRQAGVVSAAKRGRCVHYQLHPDTYDPDDDSLTAEGLRVLLAAGPAEPRPSPRAGPAVGAVGATGAR
jgi:DNA-binding transcriptional ArsR family regulator